MLNKELLLSTNRVPSVYDEYHFAVRMRAITTSHYVWDYSEDINNVVGGRIPWWVYPNNFLKKIDLDSWSFIYQSNAPANVVRKNNGLDINGYALSGYNYGTIRTVSLTPLININEENNVNVRFINYLKKYNILCIKFGGTYTDRQGQEESYAPTAYLYL